MTTFPITKDLLITPEHDAIARLDGAITAGEGSRLAFLASRLRPGAVIVEIGPNEGMSTLFMAAGLRFAGNETAVIHSVDVWDLGGPSQEPNFTDRTGRWNKEGRFARNVKALGFEGVVFGHKAESTEFAKTWSRPIDMLFIDAGHDYQWVSADYRAWSPFVREDGVLAFHDYADPWPGVIRLVNETARAEHPKAKVALFRHLISLELAG